MKANLGIASFGRVHRSRAWLFVFVMVFAFTLFDHAAAQKQTVKKYDVSDAALVKSLPGFENGYSKANDIRMHYVIGGEGTPLVLLPGWPFDRVLRDDRGNAIKSSRTYELAGSYRAGTA